MEPRNTRTTRNWNRVNRTRGLRRRKLEPVAAEVTRLIRSRPGFLSLPTLAGTFNSARTGYWFQHLSGIRLRPTFPDRVSSLLELKERKRPRFCLRATGFDCRAGERIDRFAYSAVPAAF